MPHQAIRVALLRWYDREKRDLPWRHTSDPWAILISEVMLQQTRVETVIPYYHRFLERFPTPRALAAADEEQVLALWAGLGYYRRARNLIRAAVQITEHHDGEFPRDHAEILELPGVGRYTAGAVSSIAFDAPEPLVDGNVARVLSRLFLVEGDPRKREVDRRLWELALELLHRDRSGDFNQALMELGALICLPKIPRCAACPLAADCQAHEQRATDRFPTPREKKEAVPVRLVAIVLRRGRSIGLVRRAEGRLMQGLFDLPSVEISPDDDAATALRGFLRDRLGVTVRDLEPLGSVGHGVTHHKITAEVMAGAHTGSPQPEFVRELPDAPPDRGIAPIPDEQGLQFMTSARMEKVGLSALARKMLALDGR